MLGFIVAALAITSTARAQYPFDVLHSFSGFANPEGPRAPLIEGRDGNLSGTTGAVVQANLGTVFRMTRAGW